MGHEITFPLDLVYSKNGLELPLILAQSGATIQPEQANQILPIIMPISSFPLTRNILLDSYSVTLLEENKLKGCP